MRSNMRLATVFFWSVLLGSSFNFVLADEEMNYLGLLSGDRAVIQAGKKTEVVCNEAKKSELPVCTFVAVRTNEGYAVVEEKEHAGYIRYDLYINNKKVASTAREYNTDAGAATALSRVFILAERFRSLGLCRKPEF